MKCAKQMCSGCTRSESTWGRAGEQRRGTPWPAASQYTGSTSAHPLAVASCLRGCRCLLRCCCCCVGPLLLLLRQCKRHHVACRHTRTFAAPQPQQSCSSHWSLQQSRCHVKQTALTQQQCTQCLQAATMFDSTMRDARQLLYAVSWCSSCKITMSLQCYASF